MLNKVKTAWAGDCLLPARCVECVSIFCQAIANKFTLSQSLFISLPCWQFVIVIFTGLCCTHSVMFQALNFKLFLSLSPGWSRPSGGAEAQCEITEDPDDQDGPDVTRRIGWVTMLLLTGGDADCCSGSWHRPELRNIVYWGRPLAALGPTPLQTLQT